VKVKDGATSRTGKKWGQLQLRKYSITEQRSFLKSFVERIEVDESEAKVYYTIPMPPYSVSEETVGVLPFVHHG